MTKWLAKANDDVLSHCQCDHAIAAAPGQLDCPWCGCGWLICRTYCHKAFTFAEVVEVDRTYRELCERDFGTRGVALNDLELDEAAAWMAEAVASFRIGEIVVYLDGIYLPRFERDLQFDGAFAAHDLASLPHADAIATPGLLQERLGDSRYWSDRELPGRNSD